MTCGGFGNDHDFGMLRIGLDNVDLGQEFELLQIDESFVLL